jgi:hypothetical protein
VRLTGQLDHNNPSTTSYFSDYTCGRVAGSGTGQTGIVTESHSKLGLGYPRDAVRFAETAQGHAGSRATPRVRAVFALHEARGLASLKAGSACEAALATSTSYFDDGPRNGDPNWIGYLNEEEHATLAGVCLMDLGRVIEAGGLLDKGAGSLEGFARNRSSSATFYMRNLLLRREIEQACAIGCMAVPVIFSLSSARIVNQFQSSAKIYRGIPALGRLPSSSTAWACRWQAGGIEHGGVGSRSLYAQTC